MEGMTADDSSRSSASTSSRSSTKQRRVTAHGAARFVVSWVRSTPGTHIWLLFLAVNSGILAVVSPSVRSFLLHHNSTNLIELRKHPIRVLIVSALWIEVPSGIALYFVLYELVHAHAERWLGTPRWLAVAAIAHIGATLISQKAVLMGIDYDQLPRSLVHTVDIGVSYGLAGVVGVLTYRVPRPWCWLYAAGALGFFTYPLLSAERSYTDLGHFTAVLLGFACYPMTPTKQALGD
jgi:hypothetical protein